MALGLVCTLIPSSTFAASGGWADATGGVTGGAAGPTVTVSSAADLINYAQTETGPYVIRVSGTILLSAALGVNSNKTIEGVDTNSTIDGEIVVNTGKSNVIIRNLIIANDRTIGTGDGVRLYGCNHVWVDRCTLVDCDDGMIDNSNNTDYITISWCKFYYTRDNGHNFVNLIGGSDTDPGNYRITFHHNWWGSLCRQRMPADRFGQVHMYNNYFSCSGNIYCSNARLSTQILSENNYYNGVNDPLFKDGSSSLIRANGNIYVSSTGLIDAGTDSVFSPAYGYSLDATSDVPMLVMAGAGNVTRSGDLTPPSAPTGLTATASTSSIALDWADNTEADFAFYAVKRSVTNGGPYTVIASGLTQSAYTDNLVDPGMTYHYVVSTVDTFTNQSANSAQVSVTMPGTLATTIYQINAAGPDVSPYAADTLFSGGGTYSNSNPIDTTAVINPAPTAVYQSERHGNFTYTFPDLNAGGSYQVRLHFAEIFHNAVGIRVFNVSINGTQVLTNYDVYAAAGAKNKAIIEEFAVTANAGGQIVVQYTSVTDNALVSGIEILNSPTVPAVPTGLSATAISSSRIDLTWAASSDATSYNVKRSTTSGGPYTTIATGVTGTSYSDTGLSASTTYYYVVSAVNSVGESANSAQAGATTQSVAAAPNAPSSLAAVGGPKKVNLSWADNSTDETKFEIERSTDGSTFAKITEVGASVTTYQNTGLTSKTTYYYRVRAVNANGASTYSNIASATTR